MRARSPRPSYPQRYLARSFARPEDAADWLNECATHGYALSHAASAAMGYVWVFVEYRPPPGTRTLVSGSPTTEVPTTPEEDPQR